jgi:predicted kinase
MWKSVDSDDNGLKRGKTRLDKLIERRYPEELSVGIKVEMEHTKDVDVAAHIARDHLQEDPKYYEKLNHAGLIDEPAARAEVKKLGLRKSVPADIDQKFYDAFKKVFGDNEGRLYSGRNGYKLKALDGFPKGVDLENCDIIRLGKDVVYFAVGGDWQQSLNVGVGMRDGKLRIVSVFENVDLQKKTDMKQVKLALGISKSVQGKALGIGITDSMQKSLNTGRLVRKQVDVNRGGRTFKQNKWVRPDEAGGSMPGAGTKDPEDTRGAAAGYGMHNIQNGDQVAFSFRGKSMMGTVIDDGCDDGVVVKDAAGDKFPVPWKDITGFRGADGAKRLEAGASGGGKRPGGADTDEQQGDGKDFIEPEKFNADEWKKEWDEPDATPESIIGSFGDDAGEIKKAIEVTQVRLKRLEQTIATHRITGEGSDAIYDDERKKIHQKIFSEILSPERIASAKPEEGKRPTFTMLGGRGGSGKSWFKGKVYDPEKAIVLDADEIKAMLPEYEGFNASQVHEESSDILEKILSFALNKGLNVVLDATMKTEASALKKVERFKKSGYRIEAHYMHLPRQEAAKRAISRFMGKTKRYVPVKVVLENIGNEATFEAVKKHADAWSFRDNNVAKGEEPKLISEYNT